MEIPQNIWLLIARNLSGEATDSESISLRQYIAAHPELAQQYDVLQRLWKHGTTATFQEDATEQNSVNRILQLSALQQPSASQDEITTSSSAEGKILFFTKRKWWMVAAAAIIIPLILVFSANKEISVFPSGAATVVVAQNGSKTRTILPDGSTVFLNAGSSISYNKNFNEKIREITLKGEAFFDVVKNKSKPFIVHAGNINIKVLGTAFNVKSYAADKTIETTLLRGLVQITDALNESSPPVYLHPNQKLVVNKVNKLTEEEANKASLLTTNILVTKIDSSLKAAERVETSWVYDRLEFRDDNFYELAKKLERWYAVEIHFEDEATKQLKFNGSLENETIEQAMIALKTVAPFTFKINGHDIFITSQK